MDIKVLLRAESAFAVLTNNILNLFMLNLNMSFEVAFLIKLHAAPWFLASIGLVMSMAPEVSKAFA